MAVLPATLLATKPFNETAWIPVTSAKRTVNHVSWNKKQVRLPKSSTRRSIVNQNGTSPSSSSTRDSWSSRSHRHRKEKVDVRPLGSMSEMQLMRLTRTGDIELEQVRRDAGISPAAKVPPFGNLPDGSTEGNMQLPNIKGDGQNCVIDVEACDSERSEHSCKLEYKHTQNNDHEIQTQGNGKGEKGHDGKKATPSLEGPLKERRKSGSAFQRVGGQCYSRVDMVRNLQKHKKPLSSTDGRLTAGKGERRQQCAASKVKSYCWGDNKVIVRDIGREKEQSTTGSNTSSKNSNDDLTSGSGGSSVHGSGNGMWSGGCTMHVIGQGDNLDKRPDSMKLPPTPDKWTAENRESSAVRHRKSSGVRHRKLSGVRQRKSVICRLPQVENIVNDEVDLSTDSLEDVILAKFEDDDCGHDIGYGVKEERIQWEGMCDSPDHDYVGCGTRPTAAGRDHDVHHLALQSEVATPELSNGALINDECERDGTGTSETKRKTMKHTSCSAVLKDMKGNLPNTINQNFGDDIAENVIRKLQPPYPHVIWPENRFMTSNTVFVYGSPSKLAPVIVPTHSVDCPLCNFYTPSTYGEICPPNSPTQFLKKDYGFYPIERFYSDNNLSLG